MNQESAVLIQEHVAERIPLKAAKGRDRRMAESCTSLEEESSGLNDPDLFTYDVPDKGWCVLYTRSRREKKIAERCLQFGIHHYLPLRKSIAGRRGRRYTAMVPIFPGYVFAYMDWADRRRLLQTNHIARVIDAADQEKLVSELRDIRRVEESGSFIHPVSKIAKGKRVRIIDGPLFGIEGTVSRIKGKSYLVLKVNIVNQAVACEIDMGMVVPA